MNGQVPDGMEADQQQQADEDQNKGKARHRHHHLVLYALTKDREEEEEEEGKDAFYDQLQTKQGSTPRNEIKIVMGDLNAKVGDDITNHKSSHGKGRIRKNEQHWREVT